MDAGPKEQCQLVRKGDQLGGRTVGFPSEAKMAAPERRLPLREKVAGDRSALQFAAGGSRIRSSDFAAGIAAGPVPPEIGKKLQRFHGICCRNSSDEISPADKASIPARTREPMPAALS
ncbi:MAG: hypothetical protein LBF24_02130, partial [Puniceicoccales bacterium]|nr:hypothetical protein [Puniceicoccales bacterium]